MKGKNAILFLLALAQFLVVLDSAIVNVALPAIKASLGFDTASLQWVITAYIITFGGFLMLGGRIADLYGRRMVLVAGMVGFSVFSLLIGLSNSVFMLIALRALQGLAAAFMAPTALSIMLTIFEEGQERNKALSIWGLVASGGAAAGVFLGGVLTQYLGWQWCFFVNVPIGLLTVFGIMKYIPAHIKEERDKNLDIPGAILVTGGLMLLVYALTLAVQLGWTAKSTLLAFGISMVLLAVFVLNEMRAKHPLMPLSIFKIRNVAGGNLIMLPIVAGALGNFFFVSLYIQNILKYEPFITGLAFLPIPIIIGIISTRTPVLIGRFGLKPLAVAGIALVAIGIFSMTFLTPESSYFTQILPGFLVLAVGFGISFVSITVIATSGVPAHEAGLASGLLNTAQQIGGALGLAVLAVVASAGTQSALAAGQDPLLASMSGYRQAFLVASILIAIALLVAVFVIKMPKRAQANAKLH